MLWFNKNKEKARFDGESPASFWTLKDLESGLKNRFQSIEDLGEEDGFRLFGVTDNEIRFVVVFVLVQGAKDLVAEVGFLARFSGYQLSDAHIDGINRNLHLSMISLDTAGDLYLIGGIQTVGPYDPATFALVLESWRRDLVIALQGISGSAATASFPAVQFDAVRQFAENPAPQARREGEAPDYAGVLSRFMGGKNARVATCAACDGRGKTGLIARTCPACDGEGINVQRR